MTYECAICLNINHVSRGSCSACGTIPANYSMIGLPTKVMNSELSLKFFTPVVVARGADRTEQHRNVRVNLRTALADYSD